MERSVSSLVIASALLLIAGCASVPTGPSVLVLPGSGKHFEQFRSDDSECRQYAQQQLGGGGADQAAVGAGVRSAVVGTVVGAAAGAAMGGHQGAGVGAGLGLLVGSVAGTGAAEQSGYGAQRNYDHAYIQCMYAKGHQVPGARTLAPQRAPVDQVSAPTGAFYPPPPPEPLSR